MGTVSQTVTTTGLGNVSIPAGVTSVTAECWPAAVKEAVSGAGVTLGGGGGGAYSEKLIVAVSAGNVPVTVGAGSPTTAAGGDSWFSTAATVLAKGGLSAANNSATGVAGGLSSAGIGDTKFSGGTGRMAQELLLAAAADHPLELPLMAITAAGVQVAARQQEEAQLISCSKRITCGIIRRFFCAQNIVNGGGSFFKFCLQG